MNRILAGLAVASLGLVLIVGFGGDTAQASAPVHSVTGSGGFNFFGLFNARTTIAAHEDDDGSVRGSMVHRADLRALGLGLLQLKAKPTCMNVDGDRAIISGPVTHSSNPDIVPVGRILVVLVEDLGGNGEDIMTFVLRPALDDAGNAVDCNNEGVIAVLEFLANGVTNGNGNYKVK